MSEISEDLRHAKIRTGTSATFNLEVLDSTRNILATEYSKHVGIPYTDSSLYTTCFPIRVHHLPSRHNYCDWKLLIRADDPLL